MVLERYSARLLGSMNALNWTEVQLLAEELKACFFQRRQVFICGNGGSGANAIHIANDFLYGITKRLGHARDAAR